MFDNDSSLPGATFESAPLSTAFGKAWNEWLSFWQSIHQTGAADAPATDGPANQVAEQLHLIARRLWRSCYSSVGDAQREHVKDTLFAFVALVDDFLLFTPWAGQAAWLDQTMEVRMFKTRMAGDRLPLEIKKLLDARDPAMRDLATVYLLCLTLGFQGRLRHGNGKALHEKWRRALFTFSRQRPPSLDEVQIQMDQLTARAVQQMPLRTSMPDGYRLAVAVSLGLVLLIGLGQGLWWNIQQRVAPSLAQTVTEQPER